MNKLFLFIGICLLFSCQEDDVCIDSTTPSLNLSFRDGTDNRIVEDSIILNISNDDGTTTDTTFFNTNAISLRLPVLNATEYNFIIRRSLEDGSPSDNITFNYELGQAFISKACGFKTTYLNLQESATENDIDSIVLPMPNEIINEQDSVFIYYPN